MDKQTNKHDTLLSRFINDRVKHYIEPSRQGTPRGETIGFSDVKYLATLSCGLIQEKQKEIAEELKISHGLLRKWNTEEPFKKLMERHCREFATVFMQNIRERIARREALNEAYFAQSVQAIASQSPPSMSYEEIADAKLYSEKVHFFIAKAFDAEIKTVSEKKNFTMQMELLAMIGVLKFFSGIKENKTITEKEEMLRKKLLEAMVNDCIEVLQKPTLSKEDRKTILVTLKFVANR